MRLAIEVVVDDLATAGAARQVEVDRAVEPTRPQQRGVEIRRPVGGADDEHVGRRRHLTTDLAVRRQPPVDNVDAPVPQPRAKGRRVEGLELDEQLVDDARHALTAR